MKTLLKVRKSKGDKMPKIKIQLDYKTLVTVRSMANFNTWKMLYPEARIVS